MAKKVLLKDSDNSELLPITRAELILDSEGKQAFRSAQLLATTDLPGLMSVNDKRIVQAAAIIKETTDEVSSLTNVDDTPIYPKTIAKAVIINNTNLEDYLNDKLTLDERPTKDSINGIKSGGVYAEFEDVVGVIYTNLKQV